MIPLESPSRKRYCPRISIPQVMAMTMVLAMGMLTAKFTPTAMKMNFRMAAQMMLTAAVLTMAANTFSMKNTPRYRLPFL